jgi:ribosome biogenesis protein NSA2
VGVARRKKEARSVHKKAEFAQKVHGIRAKLYNKQRHNEKIQMKKTCVLTPYRHAQRETDRQTHHAHS